MQHLIHSVCQMLAPPAMGQVSSGSVVFPTTQQASSATSWQLWAQVGSSVPTDSTQEAMFSTLVCESTVE
eukprot:1461597-Amphidinium_carterae.1